MSSSKKNRTKANQRLKPKRQPRERSNPVLTTFVELDIHREVEHITQLAQAADSRIVTLRNLVLFSTRTRDAWLLDAEDDFALCLCREGEPQPYRIIDSPSTFAIEWTADFVIEGATFIVQERTGRVVAIHGYPTVEIAAACRGVHGGD